MSCDYKSIFLSALSAHRNDARWTDADFGGIKIISNTKVGSVGQDFIEKLCGELGIKANFPINEHGDRLNQSPWDIELNGVKFELKTATEDVSGNFQFNHVRYHRPYQALLCLGVSPNALHFGVWSKADVVTGKAGNLVSMEKAANASFKLTKRPQNLIPIDKFDEVIKKFTQDFT
jgi:hypothetical protein